MAWVLAHGVFLTWCHLLKVMAIERAIDLTDHANSQSHLEDVILDAYKNGILDEIGKPTILLGHSIAGFPIAAALAIPDLINRLMFLCAYVPMTAKICST